MSCLPWGSGPSPGDPSRGSNRQGGDCAATVWQRLLACQDQHIGGGRGRRDCSCDGGDEPRIWLDCEVVEGAPTPLSLSLGSWRYWVDEPTSGPGAGPSEANAAEGKVLELIQGTQNDVGWEIVHRRSSCQRRLLLNWSVGLKSSSRVHEGSASGPLPRHSATDIPMVEFSPERTEREAWPLP